MPKLNELAKNLDITQSSSAALAGSIYAVA